MAKGKPALRDRIIDASIKLLKTDGLKKLAQPQVARLAGIPQGHLTYYFPKRSDLLLAVAERGINAIAEALPRRDGRAKGTRGIPIKNQKRVLKLVGDLLKDHERTRMMLGLIVECDENPALRTKLAGDMKLAHSLTAEFFGRDEDDLDASIAFAAICGFCVLHFLMGDKSVWKTEPFLKRLNSWLNKG